MLSVFLHGRLTGTIGFSSSGITSFAFDEEYIADPQRPTLSQGMLDRHGEPRAPRRSQFGRLPPSSPTCCRKDGFARISRNVPASTNATSSV
ncbi:MAG: hypothetical protein QOI11_81 [Candidatus Eremiobacteraeota bacterium]|jgi:hypothetical protein|nr:hypothetical protein [Candidatus Eremiobacteraeota bacterium]